MLGITNSNDLDSIAKFLMDGDNSELMGSVKLKKDHEFKPTKKPKEVHIFLCEKYGASIQVTTIIQDDIILTIAPGFFGKSFYPFIISDISPSGAYEAEVFGTVVTPERLDGYPLAISIPNLALFHDVRKKSAVQVCISGIFQNAIVGKPELRKIKAKGLGGKEVVMGKEGLIWPRDSNNRFFPYYIIQGKIMEFYEGKNSISGVPLAWFRLDTNIIPIEVVGNVNYMNGKPRIGDQFRGYVWMQGFFLKLIDLSE